MCGICGIVSSRGSVDRARLEAMSATLVHRGRHVEQSTPPLPEARVPELLGER